MLFYRDVSAFSRCRKKEKKAIVKDPSLQRSRSGIFIQMTLFRASERRSREFLLCRAATFVSPLNANLITNLSNGALINEQMNWSGAQRTRNCMLNCRQLLRAVYIQRHQFLPAFLPPPPLHSSLFSATVSRKLAILHVRAPSTNLSRSTICI